MGRSAYNHSAELTIYLKCDEKGKGTGRKLYEALEQALSDMGSIKALAGSAGALLIVWQEKG